MANRKSITLLSDSADEFNLVGTKYKASGYYGNTEGLQTVQATFNNFTGGFAIQGTLAVHPEENDWFNIELPGIADFDNDPLLKFPTDLGPSGYTGTKIFNIRGSFTYFRVVVDRSYIVYDAMANYGQVQNVRLCQ